MSKTAERFEDMSQSGRLRLLQQDDGDIIVCVIPDLKNIGGATPVSVEFCTSGGKSPIVLEALRQLMLAIDRQNRENPHCTRLGKHGLGVDG